MFPQNKMKAFTLSYDDGIYEDKRFVALLNQYGLKCTFNLNSGIQTPESNWELKGKKICRMPKDGLPELYRGHEIACHGVTHADLTRLSREEIIREMGADRDAHEKDYGVRPIGMAYPFGTYNDLTDEVLREMGFLYARTIEDSLSFDVPAHLPTFHPTCHHDHKELFRLAEEFIAMEATRPQIFYVWGHAYEFEVEGTWDRIEEFFRLISGHDDIFYGTNKEVFEALK